MGPNKDCWMSESELYILRNLEEQVFKEFSQMDLLTVHF